jgi:hypothetical protein
MSALSGYKTYIVAALALLVGAAELAGFDVVPGVDKANAMDFILNGVIGATLRSGISTAIKPK